MIKQGRGPHGWFAPIPLADKFWDKVEKTLTCWIWTKDKDRGGYGRFWTGKKRVLAHRMAYELTIGPIPEGLTLDHLCRNRICVNPSHLEPVTREENLRRGLHRNQHTGKTHCKYGHPLSGHNVYWHPNGARYCRECGKARMKRWYAAKSSKIQQPL